MHSRRVIYRDLKLENCLLTFSGYLKLTDLGISKVCIGKTYTVCGTTDYFAPETLRQGGHNRAVDWWALGIVERIPWERLERLGLLRQGAFGFVSLEEGQELWRLLRDEEDPSDSERFHIRIS